ncbi:MAG: proton-conducting transporter membrane subunit [Hyphomicrobiales bacterium]
MKVVLVAMIALPLAMLSLLALRPLRPLIVRSLGLAPLPALILLPAAWESQQRSYGIWGSWTLVLDQPGALMLGASAILWCIGGFAASAWLRSRAGQTQFAMWWLLTLSGSLGVFVAGDLVSFYLLYAAASLPAYGLIVFAGGEGEMRAGKLTLAAALLGEAFILAAFVMLASDAAGAGLQIRESVAAAVTAPHVDAIIALVILGFGFKIGLVPLHGWMPPSYSAGPLVATAVLSGATSKAGMVGLIRFLPLDVAMPGWGLLLLTFGLISAFFGAIIGLTQSNPRSVLAYSSISQLGQMAAALGAGLSAGNGAAALMVAFYAVYHVLTKGGLFFALGMGSENRAAAVPRWSFLTLAGLALGFAGLPLTGGALGKLALKPLVDDGITGLLLSLAAVGSTVLMLHFLRLFGRSIDAHTEDQNSGMAPAWVVTAIIATVLPWWLFTAVTGMPLSSAVDLKALGELFWPIALGMFVAWSVSAMGLLIPRLPPGDFLMPSLAHIARGGDRLTAAIAWLDRTARQWQISSVLLLAAVLLISCLLFI